MSNRNSFITYLGKTMPQPFDWEVKLRTEALDKNIAENVILGIKRLFEEDALLLTRNTHEQSVTAALACHLKPLFTGWHVDCEFNRDAQSKDDKKRGKDGVVKPDIIVHRRGRDENLLALELKVSIHERETKKDRDDIQKLDGYIAKQGYQHALFLKFQSGSSGPGVWRAKWIQSCEDHESAYPNSK